jgi:hypothetical protein
MRLASSGLPPAGQPAIETKITSDRDRCCPWSGINQTGPSLWEGRYLNRKNTPMLITKKSSVKRSGSRRRRQPMLQGLPTKQLLLVRWLHMASSYLRSNAVVMAFLFDGDLHRFSCGLFKVRNVKIVQVDRNLRAAPPSCRWASYRRSQAGYRVSEVPVRELD